jgi:hypothetical protein
MEFIKNFKRQNGALESASHQMEEQFADNQNFHFSPASSSPPQHSDGYVDKPTPTINNQLKGLPRTHLIGGNSLLAEISAAASLATFDHNSHSSNPHEWDFG